uniref:Uncharacterized protein n=2 Tax=Anguilla anguilla TaxID=7936 RepID=A0A0E9UGI9_ANGAN
MLAVVQFNLTTLRSMHFEACTLENVNFVLIIKVQMQEELGLLQR